MEHTGQYLHLLFLMTAVCSSSPGTKANYAHPWTNNITAWASMNPNSTSRPPSETNTSPVTPPAVEHRMSPTNMPASSATVPAVPTSTPKTSVPQASRNSSPTVEIKSQGESFKKDVCEENNSNTAMLICLIVIAVLFLICTFLFLSTVVLANKVSSLRRSKQVSKRQPRSNGDFLASSGLWTAESDTWKRAKELTGPNLLMQSTGVLTASRERKHEEGTEKLN
ncbi:protein EVI2A [Meriones unguiculatus]|uniref:protein EVI2A n=1 Tax=Meriones unguiculatus TaxID=10047 RepID=UPI000B4FCBE3|nr:protein EVI2A-like [Meriones unguiculatus]XP_021518772.1 protein EVI2A [Meriones unguiculatus]